MTQRRTNSRLLVTMAALLVGFALILARAAYVQVVIGADYRALARDQQETSLEIAASRGVVYDRDGEGLAVSQPMMTVVAEPKSIADTALAAKSLAAVLGRPAGELQALLDKRPGSVFVARKVDSALAQRVAALSILGVDVVTETRAAHNPVNDLVGQFADVGGPGRPAGSPSLMAIQASPRRVLDHRAAAERLAGVLGTPAEDLEAILDKRPSFLFIERKIDPSVADRVRALHIAGISVIPEDKRVYPKGAFAPQLMGFVDTDNRGVAGLEKQYDSLLKGEAGTRTILKDPSGRSLDVVMDRAERPGSPLSLTIDEDIQFTTEQVLTETVKTYGAKRATAVVLNPRNGDILAMANTPVFDANAFGKATLEAQRNMAVNDLYEPGSTFKMVVVAAALEMGLVRPDTIFTLPKTVVVGGRTIHESHEDTISDVRELTVREILAQSSNIGAVTLGLEVGKGKLIDMIQRFGFGKPLGIDFPGEAGGLLLPAKEWSASTIGNVPIGQGISTTPLQMACAYAAIANDGVMVQPHLAKAADMTSQRRVVSSTIAAELRSMLTWTVKGGTGKAAGIQGYEVAGKTGTAQKVQEGGGYSKEHYVASFVGMVPADKPQLVILVVLDDPAVGQEHLGGQVAAPAFSRIAEFVLKHLEIPPTENLGISQPAPLPTPPAKEGE